MIKKLFSMQYRISQKTCTGCGACLEVCPTEAIRLENGRAVITMECIACGACPRVCPEGAIKQARAAADQNSKRTV